MTTIARRGSPLRHAVAGLQVGRSFLTTIVSIVMIAGSAAAGAQSLVSVGARQLVIPFENATRDARGAWLTEGSAILLTDNLNALGAQAITRDARLMAFDRLRVPPVPALSRATVIRLGQLVGAAQVVLGSFDLNGDRVTVRARAIRLDTGRLFPEVTETGALADLLPLYERIARRLLPDARVAQTQLEQARPPQQAFELYVKGLLAETPAAQIALLNESIGIAPSFQRPRLALWAVHSEEGAHVQAMNVVQLVPDAHPQGRQARFLGALSLIHLGEHQKAYDALTALNATRQDPALLNDLGVVQLRRPASSRSERAVWYFARAVAADQRDPDLFFNLGYASWLDRDIPGAITALREAVRRNPADHEAHYLLGVALQTSGSSTEAAREQELAQQLSSTVAAWKRQLAANAVPRGLERLRTSLEGDEPRLDDVLVAAGQRDQRELAAFHLASGKRLLQSDRDAEAIGELRRAIFLAPYDSEAHLLLGRAYLRAGRTEEAVAAFKISLWSEDTTLAHVALAEALIQANDIVAARSELQKAIAREPANADARRLLATLP